PRCAGAEACALAQRPGAPRQLAARDRKLLVDEMGERRDHPRRAVAPLHADPAVAVVVESPLRDRRPVDEPIFLDGEAPEGLRDVGDIAEREHTACEPVRRTEVARAFPDQPLRPQAVRVALVAQPLDARSHVEPELATRATRPGTAIEQFATL